MSEKGSGKGLKSIKNGRSESSHTATSNTGNSRSVTSQIVSTKSVSSHSVSTGRRDFIKTVAFGGAGVMLVPSMLASCGSSGSVRSAGSPAAVKGNLIRNGDFSLSDPSDRYLPAGWQVGPHRPGESVTLSGDRSHSGEHSALQRRVSSEAFYYYLRQQVSLQPGALYRLRFQAWANPNASDMLAVNLSCRGPEGPAWLYRPVKLKADGQWEAVEVVFRAQSGFNPLEHTEVEFRMHQWRPDTPWRQQHPGDDHIEQDLYIDTVSLVRVEEGSRVRAGLSRYLRVPGHDHLRMLEAELSLGDGTGARQGTVQLHRQGRAMRQVEYLDQIAGAGDYAWSARSHRVYVLAPGSGDQQAPEDLELTYEAYFDRSGDALLGLPTATGRVLRQGHGQTTRVPLELDSRDFDRADWPVTQGLAFPQGALADEGRVRLLDPDGRPVSLQIRPTSYWADDSVRWALLDFNVNASAGRSAEYVVEFGASVPGMSAVKGIQIQQSDEAIQVDGGRVQFRVSRDRFAFLEDLQVDGRRPLDGPGSLTVHDASGKEFRASAERPYAVVVEESGPLRAVIAVRGRHGDGQGGRFLTYTTRIHVYKDQAFVKVFHTLTNREQEQQMLAIRYTERSVGFPEDGAPWKTKNIPGRGVSDARVRLPVRGAGRWQFAGGGQSSGDRKYGPLRGFDPDWEGNELSGTVATGEMMHSQEHHEQGTLRGSDGRRATGYVPGVVTLHGSQGPVTVGVYRYANLFPKQIRASSQGLQVGLMPFGTGDPHPLLRGTARTTEMLLVFDPDGQRGRLAARSFVDPAVVSNPQWYCTSHGFMGDPLVPANEHTSGTYDRLINSYMENNMDPYPPGRDDCGMANYGDFLHSESGGYNDWLNLEYDGDLGLYIHFARTGDRRAYLRGVDASRHFLDSDTAWHTGDFYSHGGNFKHDVAHYCPTLPAGHTYTVGLMHYYVLTGDRRALEATRTMSDCVNRVLYHRARVMASMRSDKDVVAPHRSHQIPGGASTSVDSRNYSDPARYMVHSYLVTGEARFLEGSASLVDTLVKSWPKAWLQTEDYYVHYRWPQVLGRIYDLTGARHLRELMVNSGKWTLEQPYARYGEFRVAQSYGRGPQVPHRTNNTRNLFLTFWAWKITGERAYLDWLINMFDAQMERRRHEQFNLAYGKDLGKYADNPARALPWVVPYRMVLVEPSPERFNLIPPARDVWKLTIGNTSETPLEGRVELGPVPEGIQLDSNQNFELALGQEATLEFPIHVTGQAPSGRVTIPYRVLTTGADGRRGERNGFFAAHLLRRRIRPVPDLIFHAPLDDAGPVYALGGDHAPVLEREDFIPDHTGRGRAFGAGSQGWSFDLNGSIYADEGTCSLWIKPTGRTQSHSIFRVRGYGWLFLGIFTSGIQTGRNFTGYSFSNRPEEWIHVAVTWDLDETAVWVDGKLVQKAKRTHLEIPTGELWGQPMERAAFDDIRIYSFRLPDERIKSLSKN